MTVVYDTLNTPDDEPLVGAKVMILLAAGRTGRAYYPPDEIAITGRVHTVTDATGRWEADLLDNGDLTPADTFYFVQVAANDNVTRAYGFQLNGEVGPVNVQDILVDLPHGGPEDPLPGGGAVDSVNAQTGVVVLDAADVGADPAGTAATAVAAEAAIRAADDLTLQGNITTETNARVAADDALDGRVDSLEAFDAGLRQADSSSDVIPNTSVAGFISWDLAANPGSEAFTLAEHTVLTSARLATNIALTATYDNGAFGAGATLTGAGALGDIDFISPAVGDRLLVKNQANRFENGLYDVQALDPFILMRSPEIDLAGEFTDGVVVEISSGRFNKGARFKTGGGSALTIGTSPIIWQGFRHPMTDADLLLGGSRNRRRYFTDFEEVGENDDGTAGAVVTVNNATIGGTPFAAVLSGTGAQVALFTSESGTAGYAQLSTGTAAGGACAVIAGVVLGQAFRQDEPASFGARMKIVTASDGTNTFSMYVGMLNFIIPAAPQFGLYFESIAGGNWFAVANSNDGTPTSVDTGIAPGTSYRVFKIIYDEVTATAYYYLTNAGALSQVAAISTDLPPNDTGMFGSVYIDKSAGTTARTAHLDWMSSDLLDTRSLMYAA